MATLSDWADSQSLTNLVLLSDADPKGEILTMFGVMSAGASFPDRANLLIDESGVFVWMKTYPAAQKPDLQEILDWIDNN